MLCSPGLTTAFTGLEELVLAGLHSNLSCFWDHFYWSSIFWGGQGKSPILVRNFRPEASEVSSQVSTTFVGACALSSTLVWWTLPAKPAPRRHHTKALHLKTSFHVHLSQQGGAVASGGASEVLDPREDWRALIAKANTQSPRTETHPGVTKGLLHQSTLPTPLRMHWHMTLPSFHLAQAARAQMLRWGSSGFLPSRSKTPLLQREHVPRPIQSHEDPTPPTPPSAVTTPSTAHPEIMQHAADRRGSCSPISWAHSQLQHTQPSQEN